MNTRKGSDRRKETATWAGEGGEEKDDEKRKGKTNSMKISHKGETRNTKT